MQIVEIVFSYRLPRYIDARERCEFHLSSCNVQWRTYECFTKRSTSAIQSMRRWWTDGVFTKSRSIEVVLIRRYHANTVKYPFAWWQRYNPFHGPWYDLHPFKDQEPPGDKLSHSKPKIRLRYFIISFHLKSGSAVLALAIPSAESPFDGCGVLMGLTNSTKNEMRFYRWKESPSKRQFLNRVRISLRYGGHDLKLIIAVYLTPLNTYIV